MAKKSSVAKQKKRESLVALKRDKRAELKKAARSVDATEEERAAARIKLDKMSPNTSAVRLHNRCQLTGRSRAYLRKFKVSRLCFRELASMGLIPGLTKASW